GEAEFDLTVNGLNLLADGEDPDEYEVFYYANDDDYLNDDPIENPEAYTNVENPQTITLDIRKPGIECDFPLEFDIGVFSAGEAFTPGDICTDEELIDLTLQDADILQDKDSDEYGVTYFTSEEDAINGENPILNPEEFELEDPGCTTFYARVQNAEVDIDADGFEECFDIT